MCPTTTAEARQLAALRLACGLDLAAVEDATPAEVAQILKRLDRAIERERQKGLRRHWNYDLNRHIALKQARDRLRSRIGEFGAASEAEVEMIRPAWRRRPVQRPAAAD